MTQTAAIQLENARTAWNAAMTRVNGFAAAGDLDSIAETGRFIADISRTGDGFLGSMPNVMAALLEEVRAVYLEVRGGFWAAPIAPEVAQTATPEATPLNIADGTYTLSEDGETFYTIRVRTMTSGALSGKRIAEYLRGPDNGTDFQAFAFVSDLYVHVWKRFIQSPKMATRAMLLETVAKAGTLEEAGLAYAERSARCRRCNRELTVPASIGSGYGMDCAAKMGVPYGDVRVREVA